MSGTVRNALVVGAGGGIGGALVAALDARDGVERIFAAARRPLAPVSLKVRSLRVDLTDEASIAALADGCREAGSLDLIVVATGILHSAGGLQPEKRLAELDAANLAHAFAINSIGPVLVAKHLLPLLSRDQRSVFAALSARVGSISDNRTGGWYAYRASKAALNMLLKTAAIELKRTNPNAICIGLQPGTVDTGLSRPFQKHVPQDGLFSPEYAASRLLEVIADVRPEQSGHCLAWDGTGVPP